MHSLIKNAKVTKVVIDGTGATYQTATGVDGGAVYTGVVDTLGYAGLVMLLLRGVATNAHVIATSLQTGDAADGSDCADITGPTTTTVQTITDVGGNRTNQMVGYEVFKPKHRYFRIKYQRTVQNSALDGCIAILHNPSQAAPTQTVGTVGGFAVTPIWNNSP